MVNFCSTRVFLFYLATLPSYGRAFYNHVSLEQSTKKIAAFSADKVPQRRRAKNDSIATSPTISSAAFATEFQGADDTWQKFWSSTPRYLYSLSKSNDEVSLQNGDVGDKELNDSYSINNSAAASSSLSGGTVILSRNAARQTVTYETSLPLFKTTTQEQSVGMTLRQVEQDGQMSSVVLDMDTLQYVLVSNLGSSNDAILESVGDGEEKVMSVEDTVEEFVGVVVFSVKTDGIAYKSGVRPGDVVLATSATLGDQLWPKSTLEGIRSAASSRKILSNRSELEIRFHRSREHIAASEVVESFELSIPRPIGIQLQDSQDGKVIISGISANKSSSSAESMLKVGDRIVAVDSSLGSQLWPVSSVEGVVSAVTSRLPGQTIRFRVERTVHVGEYPRQEPTSDELVAEDSVSPALVGAVDGFRQLASIGVNPTSSECESSIEASAVLPSVGSKTHKLLLTRCRDVLRTYIAKAEEQIKEGLPSANKVLAFTADRVLGALADARAPLDAKTLALVMNSYTSAREPEKAFIAFETAVGLSADGSSNEATRSNAIKGKKNADSRIPADLGALNLFTATALLRAHALNGDILSARRVLAAMEGSPDNFLGHTSLPPGAWPVKLFPDVRCYNIVLAAAAKAGGEEGVDSALNLFERMAEPWTAKSDVPVKNLVTYNTMISAFAKGGRPQDAYTIFYSMKQAGIKPDKISYTSLIKALVEDGDIVGGRALLREMKENELESDVFTYNIVIKALCKRLKWYEAKNLASQMESSGVSPNSITYGLLMNGLLKAGKPHACLILFEAAYNDPKTTALTENVQLYTTAITAASALGDYERALELVARMRKVGVKPTVKTLTALMGACLACNKADLAIDVYLQIENSQEKVVDGLVLTLAVQAFCEQGNYHSAALILTQQRDGYQEMSGKELMSSYNMLFKSSLFATNFTVARSSFTELLQSGYIPSKDTFKGILQGLGIKRSREKDDEERHRNEDIAREKYDFLLFVIDSLRHRNLPCDAWIYLGVLLEGARIGGTRKLISSFLSKARTAKAQQKNAVAWSWEELTKLSPSQIREVVNEQVSLPSLYVPVNDRDYRQVLAAENAVSVIARRQRTPQAK